MGEVSHLFIAIVHRQPMREMQEVLAVPDHGLDGCTHARPRGRRQVLLMDAETLDHFGLSPGVVKENITTRGLALGELRLGQRLRVGEALLEATLPCEPCQRMDEIHLGLKQELRGRRGMLFRVLEGGRIRRGDKIEVLDGLPGDD